MTETEFVTNADALVSIFGYWPSFHDAEVLTILLDRAGDDGPTLEARIHVHEMTDEVDARGFYVLIKHTLVTLRFTDVLLRDLRWFNSQNALASLGMEEVDPSQNEGRHFGVSFDASHGVEADLLCDRIAVTSVEPFEAAR